MVPPASNGIGMPRRSQSGGRMNSIWRQHPAQSVSCSAKGSRQARHEGGRIRSEAARRQVRTSALQRGVPSLSPVAPCAMSPSVMPLAPPSRHGSLSGARRRATWTLPRDPQSRATQPMAVPIIFDRELLVWRRERAAHGGGIPDFLLRRVADEIAERLEIVNRTFATALDLGAHHGVLGRRIRALENVGLVIEAEAT